MKRGAAIALGALMAAVPIPAWADEGGQSFWTPGQYASFAASKTDPGWSVGLETYVSQGRQESGTVAVGRGGIRVNGRTQQLDIFYVAPGYTFENDVLGGQLYLGATVGFAWVDNKADAVLSRPSRGLLVTSETNVDELGWGTVDLNPLATLKWEAGEHNFMVYATGNVPTGYFQTGTLSTPSLGFWAVDGGLGYTWDGGKGLEFSVVAGVTYNFTNPYSWQSGIDGHIDAATSWMVADPVYVGVVGYFFKQLTGDVGAPTDLGDHLSRVAGLGPQVGWSFRTGHVEIDVNVRGYKEFAGQNRPEGYSAWFTVTLSQIKKTADK